MFGIITSNNAPICIGSEATSSACTGGAYFNGRIDDVMFFDKALSEYEISDIYDWTLGFDPEASDFEPEWSSVKFPVLNCKESCVFVWQFGDLSLDDATACVMECEQSS
jgi:hypothetical protein